MLPYLLVMANLVIYFSVAILPGFGKMFHSMQVELPPTLQWYFDLMGSIEDLRWLVCMAAMLAITWAIQALAWSWHHWWPGSRAIRRGRILLAGLALGATEGELARHLAATWRRAPTALAAAGETGDLAGIIRACGWRAATPQDLALRLGRATAWRRSVGLVATGILRLLLPVLLALPILFLAQGLFQVFARILLDLIP